MHIHVFLTHYKLIHAGTCDMSILKCCKPAVTKYSPVILK